MDATQAINALINGNTVGLLDALDASEVYTVTGVSAADGSVTPLGRVLVIGSTTVIQDPSGGLQAHGHAYDHEASECAEIEAIRMATLGQLAEGGTVTVTDAEGNTVPAASVETARLMAMGFPVPPQIYVAEAQALRDMAAGIPDTAAALAPLPAFVLGEPGTLDGPPVV